MKKIIYIICAIIMLSATTFATSRIPKKSENSQWITRGELYNFLDYAEKRMGEDMDLFIFNLVASISEVHGYTPNRGGN